MVYHYGILLSNGFREKNLLLEYTLISLGKTSKQHDLEPRNLSAIERVLTNEVTKSKSEGMPNNGKFRFTQFDSLRIIFMNIER